MISILYVDDEPSLLEIGKLFLERSGQFVVDIITSAPAALTLLNTKHYEAIISDYQMPEMNGIEFLKKVRTSGNTIPFILFTGRGREEIVIQALNAGVDFYLQKGGEPVSQFTELEHQIRQAIQQRKAEASIRDYERREADIINFLPDATCAIDRSGRIIAWNRAIEEMTGFKAAEMLGKGDYEYAIPFYGKRQPTLIDLIYESDEVIAKKYAHIIHVKDILIAETTIPLPHGKTITLMGKASPLYNRQGEIVGAIESIRDITKRKLDEDAIHESEQRYRNVVEDQTEFISRFLPDGTHVFVNDAYCRCFGLKRDEILGHRFRPKIPSEDQERMKRFFTSLTPDHPVDIIEHRIIMPDGNIRWQRWSDRAIFDPSGMITEYQSVGQDITERKQTEEVLRHKTALLEAQVNSSLDGILIVDLQGKKILQNRRTVELWKIPHHIADNDDDETQVRHVMHMTRYPERFVEKITYLYDHPDETSRDEVELTDGTILDRYSAPVLGKDGQNYGRIWTFRDISEHKRAEEALRESQEKLRIVLDNLPDLVLVHRDGIILYVNPAMIETQGLRSDEILKRPILDYIAPEYHTRVAAAIRERMETGRDKPYEIDLLFPGGERRAFLIRGSVIEFEGSSAILNVLTDITERKRAEEALRQANKKLNLLSGITRHDINNQMMVLQSYLTILETKQSDPSFNEYFRKAKTAAGGISDIITFTKEYESIGVNAPALQDCRTLVDTATKQATRGQVIVKNDIPAGTEILVDPLIVKVFYNLVDNAVRYGGKVTTIRFSVEERDGAHIVVCEDDGDGIPGEEKEKIFDHGFGRNTGLGLALSREILDITGITIRETGEPGKGARFEMAVPKGAYRLSDVPLNHY
jgi:PAS domain S-box-containing protein